MIAATLGDAGVVRTLLDNGANGSVGDSQGFTALHLLSQKGHLAVTKLLLKAGANLEAKISATGSTPLDVATEEGHSEVIGLLIEAGANPNSRRSDGATPLYSAAQEGHLAATQVLLRAKANPLLAAGSASLGIEHVPLDTAAQNGHLEVVDELIQEYGIEGCGGASSGVHALEFAAQNQHVEIMGKLTTAGVVDTGMILIGAAACGRKSSVKLLLQQQEGKASDQGAGYLETLNRIGATPLVCSIQACRSCSPRITRWLVDAGADTTTAVRLIVSGGVVFFDGTPLALVDYYLRAKKIGGEEATESQLHSLEGARRLLLRVEAVHAVSWLWARGAPCITHAAAEVTGRATKTTPTPVISMLPVLRRRAGKPRVLLAALFRNSSKP